MEAICKLPPMETMPARLSKLLMFPPPMYMFPGMAEQPGWLPGKVSIKSCVVKVALVGHWAGSIFANAHGTKSESRNNFFIRYRDLTAVKFYPRLTNLIPSTGYILVGQQYFYATNPAKKANHPLVYEQASDSLVPAPAPALRRTSRHRAHQGIRGGLVLPACVGFQHAPLFYGHNWPTMHQLPDENWQARQNGNLIFPASGQAVALQFWLRNEAQNPVETMLEIDDLQLDRAKIWVEKAAGRVDSSQLSGDKMPFRNRDIAFANPNFKIRLAAGETARVVAYLDQSGLFLGPPLALAAGRFRSLRRPAGSLGRPSVGCFFHLPARFLAVRRLRHLGDGQ